MGYALWIFDDVAWAAGTHEYKPLGTAVGPVQGVLRARDFSPKRRAPLRRVDGFVGLFASLEDLNRYLSRNRSRQIRKYFKPGPRPVIATL